MAVTVTTPERCWTTGFDTPEPLVQGVVTSAKFVALGFVVVGIGCPAVQRLGVVRAGLVVRDVGHLLLALAHDAHATVGIHGVFDVVQVHRVGAV